MNDQPASARQAASGTLGAGWHSGRIGGKNAS